MADVVELIPKDGRAASSSQRSNMDPMSTDSQASPMSAKAAAKADVISSTACPSLEGNGDCVEVSLPQRARTEPGVPPGYTTPEATEIWRGTQMTLLMLLCLLLAGARVGLAWRYSSSMPLVCIMLTTCTIPTFGATGAYFFIRARGQEPTWSQVTKVSMGVIFAFCTVLGTQLNLGIFALCHIRTDDRAPWEYPVGAYAIAYLLFATCAAEAALTRTQPKLLRGMALSARAEREQPPAAPAPDA